MSTVSKSFSSAGVSAVLSLQPGQSATYDVSGSFTGQVVLEETDAPVSYWMASVTGAADGTFSGTIKNEHPNGRFYRFRAITLSAGQADCAIENVEDQLIEVRNFSGGLVLAITDSEVVLQNGTAIVSAQTRDGSGSYQPVAIDLELADTAGSDDGTDTDFLAPIMGHVMGADVQGEGNYLAGVLGASSLTGPASDYPVAPLMGMLMDGAKDHDSIVHAHIDGSDPSAQTDANAAFGVSQANAHASSGVNYGLDLKGPANAHITGGLAFNVKKAEVRFHSGDVVIMVGDGAPVDGTTGDNFAGIGSFYIDYTNGNAYIQTGLITSPVWKLVTRAA